MSGAEHWEAQAERWATWARRPDFDGYWNDSGPPFFDLLPAPGRPTLVGEAASTRSGGAVLRLHHSPHARRRTLRGRNVRPSDGYLERRRFDLRVARDGLDVHFRSWAYPLETYMQAIEDAGFLVESLREPPDPNRPIPNFLLIRAVKL